MSLYLCIYLFSVDKNADREAGLENSMGVVLRSLEIDPLLSLLSWIVYSSNFCVHCAEYSLTLAVILKVPLLALVYTWFLFCVARQTARPTDGYRLIDRLMDEQTDKQKDKPESS